MTLIEWFLGLPYLFIGPQKRLERTCKALEKLPGVSFRSEKEAEAAWRLYETALELGRRCGPSELALVVSKFDRNFTGALLRSIPSVEQLVDIVLSASRPDTQNIEAAWLLSRRIAVQTASNVVQQRICLELAGRGDADRLISKMQERLQANVLSDNEISEILLVFLRSRSFADNAAWKPFFAGFGSRRLPSIHQVHALLNRPLVASELAETSGDHSSALHYLLGVSGTGLAERALTLAEGLGDPELISRAQLRIAEALVDEGRYTEAAINFERAGELREASDCYRRSGHFELAIRIFPAVTQEWQLNLRQAIEKTVQGLIADAKFLGAVQLLRRVQQEWLAKSDENLTEAERTGRLLAEVVKTARASFEKEVNTAQSKPGDEVFKRWSLLEEEAGNYLEAGLQAEMARDYFAASLLFEKAGAFGQALDALNRSTPDPDLMKKAKLLESGGDFFMAGLLYERLGSLESAVSMYEEAGEFLRAAEVLRSLIRDAEAPFDERYLSLLTKAHRVDDLAELSYSMAQQNGRSADDRARLLRRLRSLAEKGLVAQKWLALVDKELPGVEESRRFSFDQHAGEWAKAATEEVLACYVQAFGLDLGTTNSVVALYNKREQKPEVVDSKGRQMYPSVFCIDHEGREIVGTPESDWFGKSPRAVITKAKRVMGTDTRYKAGGQIYRPEEISARLITHARYLAQQYLLEKIAKRISALATQVLGTVPQGEWIGDYLERCQPPIPLEKCVITVPAYFNDAQKQATRAAGQLAGIEVLRLIHEPTAACIAQRALGENDESVLVVDLGAGTLDLSLVEVGDGFYEVKAIEGDTTLGSADLDDLLYEHFVQQISNRLGVNVADNNLARKRLRQASEEIKIELSSQTGWSINLPAFVDGQSVIISLVRTELERIATLWIERIRTTCKKINAIPSRVLLIGGGGLMPSVRACVKDVFGIDPKPGVDPLTAVARGAAIQAAILLGAAPQKLVIDAVPFGLGIKSYVAPKEYKFDILIPKHKSIPAEQSDTYTTVTDNQTAIRVEVYQGEKANPEDNFKIGDFLLDGIPAAAAGVPVIEVTFEIDVNCILSVAARDKATNRKRSIRILDSHLLAPAQISSLQERLRQTQVYQSQLDRLAKLNSAISLLFEDKLESLVYELQVRLVEGMKHYEANMSKFAPARYDEEVLLEIYRQRNEVEDACQLAVDKLSALRQSFVVWSERQKDTAANVDKDQGMARLKEVLSEGDSLKTRVRASASALQNIVQTYRRWLGVIEGLPVNPQGDAEYLAGYFLRVSRYDEALAQFRRLPPGLTAPQAEIGLEIMAKKRERDSYAEMLDTHTQLLGVARPDFIRLNHAVRLYANSVVWIQHQSEEGLFFGSGFFISPRLVATNRHVITSVKLGAPVSPETLRVVTNRGTRCVSAVYLPLSVIDDVAILELEDDDHGARPLRLAYSELIEVGERILTLGFPSPEPSGFEENLYCNTGLVNRIRQSDLCSERVLEISIELKGGISGAPILNEFGEVIGLVTYSTQRQHVTEGGYLHIDNSFYAIPVGVLRRLRSEIEARLEV